MIEMTSEEKPMALTFHLALFLLLCAATTAAAEKLIGTKAGEWQLTDWINCRAKSGTSLPATASQIRIVRSQQPAEASLLPSGEKEIWSIGPECPFISWSSLPVATSQRRTRLSTAPVPVAKFLPSGEKARE